MIRTSNLTKGQKLYFIGESGAEECEVYIPTVWMSTPIRTTTDENWKDFVFHSNIDTVVKTMDNRTRMICTPDRALFYYTEEECIAQLDRLVKARTRALEMQDTNKS